MFWRGVWDRMLKKKERKELGNSSFQVNPIHISHGTRIRSIIVEE